MKVENCTLSTGGENSLNILLVPGNIPRPQTYVTTENPILEVFRKYDLFRGSNNICMKIDKKGDRQALSYISRVLPRFCSLRECFHNPLWLLTGRGQ